MASTVGSETAAEGTAMEMFGSGGMALLPWTKQMLTVVWEQLRLLVQVIYYTFLSVFQMFRFEVHVRITDETGQHIQHMSTTSNPSESLLFSSFFDGDSGVMVGGSNPLSDFCADVGDPFPGKSTAEALLSGLRGNDLCCGLVDDFLVDQSTWKMGFPGDWNIFVSSGESSGSNEPCHGEKFFQQETKTKVKHFKEDTSEEERSHSNWSSEEDQNIVEFDSEESKALWESLSKSSDPYNPFFFSACISTNTGMEKSRSETRDSTNTDIMAVSKSPEEILGPRGLNIWFSRSDSESSWASSGSSSPDIDKEESERLWDFFSGPADPYNPMCFTACTISSTSPQTAPSTTSSKVQASLPAPTSKSDTESSFPPSSEDEGGKEDEEEQLWKSLCQENDPYHPLNFQACLQTSKSTAFRPKKDIDAQNPQMKDNKCLKPSPTKPPLPERQLKRHSHSDKTLVPWKRPGKTPQSLPENRQESEKEKKVRFSPLIQVHVMQTWPFARQASRKGHWEVLARDRERFRRRVRETEEAIGHCFTQAHREKMRAYLDGALKLS